MRIVSLLLVLLLSLSMTSFMIGCTALQCAPSPSICNDELGLDPTAQNTVEAQLMVSAKSIEESLKTLASAQDADDPPIVNTVPLMTPEGGMGGTANVDWTGPIEPLLERVADMTDYRLKVLGNEPAIPIVITISNKHAIVAEIVQNAAYQAAKRAHVIVYPNTRVIELRYIS